MTVTVLAPAIAVVGETTQSPLARAWSRLRRRKGAMVALVVLLIIITLAVFAPYLALHDPIKQGWSSVRKAPSAIHWFGTDEVGRDLFSHHPPRAVWIVR